MGGICWPQGMWELLVVKFQPKNHNWNQLLWGSSHSHSHPNRKMLLDLSHLFFPPGSLGTASAPWPLLGPASSWEEEEDHDEKSPGQTGKGKARTPSHLLSNQAKPYFTKARAGKAQVPVSQADALHRQSSHWNGTRPPASPKPGPGSHTQHQPEQRCSSSPPLPPFPGHKTKQNKRHCRDGWTNEWFGIFFFFCGCAFKWEGIIGEKKKQCWGGLAIFGAHLLEKWISLWIPEIMTTFSRRYTLNLNGHWTFLQFPPVLSGTERRENSGLSPQYLCSLPCMVVED